MQNGLNSFGNSQPVLEYIILKGINTIAELEVE